MTANPATISLSSLATHTVTYSCQTSAGDLSSALLQISIIDSSSPVVQLLGASTVTINIGDTYGSAEDAGATASDNLDGELTSAIVTTGLPVDSSVEGTKLVTHTVVDSSNLSASISRTIVVSPPYSDFNQTYQLASNATGFRISFDYSTITANNLRFLVVEVGSHPVLIAIWFGVTTGYTVVTLPGPDWG